MNMKVNQRNLICFLFFWITLFLSGFRWDVGIDWMTYYNNFDGVKDMSPDTLEEAAEPINVIIKLALMNFGLYDGRYWIWVMTIITIFFFYKSIQEYSLSVAKSILLLFIMGFFFDSLNAVRQFVAVSISMMSWKYALERKPIKFGIIIFTASLFHSSALCSTLIYFISRYEIKKRNIRVYLIIALLLAPISTIIAPKLITLVPLYDKYTDDDVIKFAMGSGNILSYLRMIFPTFFVYIIYKNFRKLYSTSFWRMLTNISLVGLYLLIAFPTTQLVIRISYYYYIAMIFLIPYVCSHIKKKGQIIWISTVVYYTIFTTITYLLKPIAKIIPYEMRFDLLNINLMVLILSVILACTIIFPKAKQIWKTN